MDSLSEQAENLAEAVVMASPDDLPGLAALHTQIQTFHQSLSSSRPAGDSALAAAIKAEQLLEQIVLGEVKDAAASMKDISSTVAELIDILDKGPGAATSGPAPEAAAAPAAPVAGAAVSFEPVVLNPADTPLVVEFIAEAIGHIESSEAALLELEEDPDKLDAVNVMFRGFHTIKGVAGFLNLKPIGALAHGTENLLDLARHGKLRLTGTTVDLVLASIDLVKAMLADLDRAVKGGSPLQAPDGLAELLSKLKDCAAGTPIAAKVKAAPAAPAAPKAAKAEGGHGAVAESVVKVSTDRLDMLVNTIGELVIAQSMIRQDLAGIAQTNHRVGRNLNHLGKIARQLQDLSMSMRMVPIQGAFQKMSRLVRDLARKAEKEIELVLIGAETELDRNLVEAISDPLVHMVRNAADHGIEMPDVRQAAGKPRAGRIELRAYHQAGNIVIDISDDGKGLAKERILKKAIEAGIVTADQQLSEQEIFKLIFHAGLSTAEKVTDVSGRGVGMDVVRKNVEALRGRIEISSVPGKGSKFTIRLPLTLAVIDGLIVKVGKERYVLPIMSVEQTIQPKREQLSTVQQRGEMCSVRGSLLPIYRLHKLFNVAPRNEDPTQCLVVIIQDNLRRCGLLVDELLSQQQVVIKTLGESFVKTPGISGGAILGDGSVSLILDSSGLMELATGQGVHS